MPNYIKIATVLFKFYCVYMIVLPIFEVSKPMMHAPVQGFCKFVQHNYYFQISS